MPQCLVIGVDGVVSASPADPCTTLVALTPSEFALYSANPFLLSPEQGVLISGAVAGVWAVAWAAKMLVRTLYDDGEKGAS